MIYTRWGEPCTLVRRGRLEDFKTFEKRRPDKADRANLETDSLFVVRISREVGDDKDSLTLLAFLRADRGFAEIVEAIEKLDK